MERSRLEIQAEITAQELSIERSRLEIQAEVTAQELAFERTRIENQAEATRVRRMQLENEKIELELLNLCARISSRDENPL